MYSYFSLHKYMAQTRRQGKVGIQQTNKHTNKKDVYIKPSSQDSWKKTERTTKKEKRKKEKRKKKKKKKGRAFRPTTAFAIQTP